MKVENAKHERFCQEYIIDLNGTKAYRRTYGDIKAARVQASKLLSKANIQDRIAELKEIRSERTVITQDMVLKELMILARSDIQDYLEVVKQYPGSEDGRLKLKLFTEMKGNATRAIKSISEHITKDGIQLKFKLHGKEKPLELLGKHLGMFMDKFDIGDNLKKLLVERIFTDKRPKE
jgi:phage terminase small subunit